jgi:hypothetical protein
MSKKQLNGPDVGALLQKVHGKCMSQGVRGDGLGDFADTVGFLALALHRLPGNVLARYITGKEPVLRPFHSPPRSQDLQQLRGEHHVTILHSLALLDPQDHALAIDGRGSKSDGLRDTQAGSVAGGQDGTVLPAGHTEKKLHDLFGT